MKLRNKKTGEIKELPDGFFCGDNLKKICEEWEDYAEPKDYWCIRENGVVGKRPYPIGIECVEQENRDEMREIGNYFDAEEEAELAVEKLKAWKRLKDGGFRFNGGDDACISYRIDTAKWNDKLDNDFDLLFGGEE